MPCGERPWLGPCLGLCWNRQTPGVAHSGTQLPLPPLEDPPQGGGLSLPCGSPDDLTVPLPLEHLLKLPLEGLQEFLQDTLSRAWALEDDAVPMQLQASMAELPRME